MRKLLTVLCAVALGAAFAVGPGASVAQDTGGDKTTKSSASGKKATKTKKGHKGGKKGKKSSGGTTTPAPK
jgi:hypothetical protein